LAGREKGRHRQTEEKKKKEKKIGAFFCEPTVGKEETK